MRLSRAPTHTVHGRRSTEPPPSPPSRPWCIPPCSHIVTLSGFSSSAAGKEAPPARPRSSPPRHTPRPHPTRVTRQILKHATVRELVMVDLDPVLVKLSEANLPYWEGVREDPRYQDPPLRSPSNLARSAHCPSRTPGSGSSKGTGWRGCGSTWRRAGTRLTWSSLTCLMPPRQPQPHRLIQGGTHVP